MYGIPRAHCTMCNTACILLGGTLSRARNEVKRPRSRGAAGRGVPALLGGVKRLHVNTEALGIFDVAVQIVELLAIDFGFGEKNVPLVALFFHFVPLFFALGALLRFEANLYFAL